MTRVAKGQADRRRLADRIAPVVMQGGGTRCEVEWVGPCQARRPHRLPTGAIGQADHACALLFNHKRHRCGCGGWQPKPTEGDI